MENIFKSILFFLVIFSYSFSKETTNSIVSDQTTNSIVSVQTIDSIVSNQSTNSNYIDPANVFVPLENPSWRRKIYSLKFDKNNKEDILKQLRRTEIIFFISFPLTFLANTLLFGGSSSSDFNRNNYEDYLSSIISSLERGFRTGEYDYTRIDHRTYNPNAFDTTEAFLWINSILWSLTIALNDPIENFHPNPDRIKKEFDENRTQFHFFNDSF